MIVSDAVKAVKAQPTPKGHYNCPVCNKPAEIGQAFKWINKRIYHLACAKKLVK